MYIAMKANIRIETNVQHLNFSFIYQFLSNTYWANHRSREVMQLCMDHSFNYGLFLNDEQIGYARLVSDLGQFAYLMDVFIDEKYRGKGYSKILMDYILKDERLKEVKIWRLATLDAHGLYEHFGFKALASPERMMELLR